MQYRTSLLLVFSFANVLVTSAREGPEPDFLTTFPKDIYLPQGQAMTIQCPEMSNVPTDKKIRYFFRFFSSAGVEEKFLNQSEGQYELDTTSGRLVIKNANISVEGRYSCMVHIEGINRFFQSSKLQLHVTENKTQITAQDDSLIKFGSSSALGPAITKPAAAQYQNNNSLMVTWQMEKASDSNMFLDFIVQVKHYEHFLEDWINVTHVTPVLYTQRYSTVIDDPVSGPSQFKVLGLLKSGAAVFSPVSGVIDVREESPFDSDGGHRHGLADPGDELLHQTPPEIITCAALSQTSVLVEWTLDPVWAGKVSGFVIMYSVRGGEYHAHMDLHEDIHVTDVHARQKVIKGLKPMTRYEFMVQVRGRNNMASKFSASVQTTTETTESGSASVNEQIENYIKQRDDGDSDLMVVVILCICGVAAVLVISTLAVVVAVLLCRQRSNQAETKLREMEEEMKRRESTLRKSVGYQLVSTGGVTQPQNPTPDSQQLHQLHADTSAYLMYSTSPSGTVPGGVRVPAGYSSQTSNHSAASSTQHHVLEQGSLLGSGCSEHSVNSSPLSDEMMCRQADNRSPPLPQPLSSMGYSRLAGLLNNGGNPMLANTGAMYNSSVCSSGGGGTNSDSKTNSTELQSPPLQPLRSLQSPCLLAKYSTQAGGGELTSFHQLKHVPLSIKPPGGGGRSTPPTRGSVYDYYGHARSTSNASSSPGPAPSV